MDSDGTLLGARPGSFGPMDFLLRLSGILHTDMPYLYAHPNSYFAAWSMGKNRHWTKAPCTFDYTLPDDLVLSRLIRSTSMGAWRTVGARIAAGRLGIGRPSRTAVLGTRCRMPRVGSRTPHSFSENALCFRLACSHRRRRRRCLRPLGSHLRAPGAGGHSGTLSMRRFARRPLRGSLSGRTR